METTELCTRTSPLLWSMKVVGAQNVRLLVFLGIPSLFLGNPLWWKVKRQAINVRGCSPILAFFKSGFLVLRCSQSDQRTRIKSGWPHWVLSKSGHPLSTNQGLTNSRRHTKKATGSHGTTLYQPWVLGFALPLGRTCVKTLLNP